MINMARVVTGVSSKWTATAASMHPIPSVPAFAAADIRVKRSGMRSTPTEATSRNIAPATISTALSASLIAGPPLNVTGKSDCTEERYESYDRCRVEKHRLIRGDVIKDDDGHRYRGDKIQRD